ncbi:MAG: ABC transporter permease subunit [Pirellulales bacterium]|nr:ABC transporter permease subunit [Pirellulales bacterium]
MNAPAKFTGHQRRLVTSPWVKWSDSLARTLITVGGIGTIIVVLLICVFLVVVVLPLGSSPRLTTGAELSALPAQGAPLLAIRLSANGKLAWQIDQSGAWSVWETTRGRTLSTLSSDQTGLSGITLLSVLPDGRLLAANASGEFHYGRVANVTTFHNQPPKIPANNAEEGQASSSTTTAVPIAGADPSPPAGNEPLILGEKLWSQLPSGKWRADTLELVWERYFPWQLSGPPRALALANNNPTALVAAALRDDGACQVMRMPLVGGALQPTQGKLIADFPVLNEQGQAPRFIGLSGLGDLLYCLWEDGTLEWYRLGTEVAQPGKRPLAYTPVKVLSNLSSTLPSGTKVTTLEMLLGGTTLLIGDSAGLVQAWFPVNPSPGMTPNEPSLVRAHQFLGQGGPIRQLIATERNRTVISLAESGSLRLLYITLDRILAEIPAAKEGRKSPITHAALNAEQTRLVTLSQVTEAATSAPTGRIATRAAQAWDYEALHPDITLAGIFLPVWYEGSRQPVFQWQTSGSESAELRFSLIPLIFGTLKATFYSLLFGAPLAFLAAIFTSEFLHPSTKARVKPLIEMMASLPSVVLGYFAGMLFAPFLEHHLGQVFAALGLVPLGLILAAYLWELLPQRITLQAGSWRLVVIALAIIPGVLLGVWSGQTLEQWIFGKSIMDWLNESPTNPLGRSSPWGGWFLLLLPLVGIFISISGGRWGDVWLRRKSQGWSRPRAALLNIVRFFALIAATVLVTALMAALLTQVGLMLGFDIRGGADSVGFERRNALVVGITMGFAIIPLIYTIADDALSTVPNHLRSASLGAGATPWQTAVRIVIPMAMSGLFSALMIGLGRAVGETMIVLMAAGNTPIMEFSIFNGFKTLSAGIASEMSETPAGSTHYRVLFLAALVLFMMTFVINTLAEVVRQRFRRRAYEL